MKTPAARHLLAGAACAAVLLATAAGLRAIAGSSPAPGVVWVLTHGHAGAFWQLQATPGVRVANHWARGRVVQLQSASLGATRLPDAAVLLSVPLPSVLFELPGCG